MNGRTLGGDAHVWCGDVVAVRNYLFGELALHLLEAMLGYNLEMGPGTLSSE